MTCFGQIKTKSKMELMSLNQDTLTIDTRLAAK